MLGQEVGEGLTEELRPQCESRQVNRSLAGGQGGNQCKAEEIACAEMRRHEKASPHLPVLFLNPYALKVLPE